MSFAAQAEGIAPQAQCASFLPKGTNTYFSLKTI
jgi:hypothetical protein